MEKEVDGVLVVAHELKAPLAVLRQLALSLDEMGAEGEHIRAQMVSVSERALKQVNDLVKVRRLEDGLFQMEPVAVRGVCDEVTMELKSLFCEKRKRVRVKYTNREKLVTANRELLHGVIYNFVINAIRYADIDTETELTVRDFGGRVRVAVRDYGPALPVKIWHEIRRGGIEQPTAIAMRPGSSGLGLFIASKFSRYMGAKVGAVRHRDGTSFYVELPVSRQASLFEL